MVRLASRSLLASACILVAHSVVSAQATPEGDAVAPGVQQPAGVVEAQPVVGEKIGITLGYDYSSHFVSYGADVWGAGNDFFSDEATNFVWADVAVDLEPFTINFGVWGDINDNTDSPLGGSIQEIDVYVGLAYTIDRF